MKAQCQEWDTSFHAADQWTPEDTQELQATAIATGYFSELYSIAEDTYSWVTEHGFDLEPSSPLASSHSAGSCYAHYQRRK